MVELGWKLSGNSWWLKVAKVFLIYFQDSTCHGMRHLSRKIHPIEFVLWVFAIISFGFLSGYNASIFWSRYLWNPTVISVGRDYLGHNITFPPITLCLCNKLNETAMEELLDERIINETIRKDPSVRLFLKKLANFDINKLNELTSIDQNVFKIDDYLRILMRISNKFTHNITLSSTSQAFYFEPIIVDQIGFCYTFNSRVAPYLSPKYLLATEKKFKENNLQVVNFYDGAATAVTQNIINNVDIVTHGPNNVPSSLLKILNTNPYRQGYSSLLMKPIPIRSEKGVKNLFVFQRNCKFTTESSSEYFPQLYTEDLCRLECRMKKFNTLCNCLPFFYIQLPSDRQCDKRGLECIYENRKIIETLDFQECGCLKDCDDTKFLLQNINKMFWFHDSRVSWTIRQSKITYQRKLIYGFIEALVQTGGNLGLFIGTSLLSFVELLYFIYLAIFRHNGMSQFY